MLRRTMQWLTALDIKLSQTILSIDIAQFLYPNAPKHG